MVSIFDFESWRKENPSPTFSFLDELEMKVLRTQWFIFDLHFNFIAKQVFGERRRSFSNSYGSWRKSFGIQNIGFIAEKNAMWK